MIHSKKKEKIIDKLAKIRNLFSELAHAKYQNNLLLMSEILEKTDVVLVMD